MLPRDSFLRLSATQLSKFVADELRPSTQYNYLLGEGMDAVALFLKNHTRFSVKKVVKGGSAGKGTTVKGKSDIDIVVFLNDFRGPSDFRDKLEHTLKTLESDLKNYGATAGHRIRVTGRTRFSVQFTLRAAGMDEEVEIDLLPAYDNLGDNGATRTYATMLSSSVEDREYYSSSLSPLQIDFIQERPALLKDLVRLVKYWKKTHFQERRSSESLPSSYPLELVVIRCWEIAGRPHNFNLAKGLKSVLASLEQNRQIEYSWRENYNADDYPYSTLKQELLRDAKRRHIPFILDPANPSRNTAARTGAWGEVADMARASCNSPCLKDIQSSNWL